uniref:Ovule protein n=1 Tax=Schistosoma curassoni TaxID=6186 RepID=A0A183KKQ7_9TREM
LRYNPTNLSSVDLSVRGGSTLPCAESLRFIDLLLIRLSTSFLGVLHELWLFKSLFCCCCTSDICKIS